VDASDDQPEIARLEALVAQQAFELSRLREQAAAEEAWQQLRRAFAYAAAASSSVPSRSHSELLELIVSTAAHVLNASHASLFLVDEQTQELVFEVALGEPIEEFKKLRLPLGRGIAGMVAVTGQAMAITDVADDPRHASEIAQRTGYTPHNLVCVPLADGDRIVGVIELMDRHDGSGFTAADLETLGQFANQAAVTIDLSRTRQDLSALLVESLSSLADMPPDLLEKLRLLQPSLQRDACLARALELAHDVEHIASYGEVEAETCHRLLHDFAAYLRARDPA
jgi:GAF domain-containing protein